MCADHDTSTKVIYIQLQWNPVNTTAIRLWRHDRFNEVGSNYGARPFLSMQRQQHSLIWWTALKKWFTKQLTRHPEKQDCEKTNMKEQKR